MRGALQAGCRLAGKYQVDRVIGGGGFGLTYLGLDLRNMKQVCIKELFIHKHSLRNDDQSVIVADNDEDRTFFMDRFIREAQSLAGFRHPHVVQVEDLFELNGTAYYVMEFVEGMTLADHVKSNGPLQPGEFRHIFRQLLDAMDAIHARGLLHRDIKPSNIMLEPGLRVKLIDFGAAKDPKVQAKSGHTVVITDGFAPLEQYSAEGNIGQHSDIYSLGSSMFFALTGERPKPATSRDLDDLVDVPQASLRELINYFMQVEPEDRPSSIAAARAEFEQALATALTEEVSVEVEEEEADFSTFEEEPEVNQEDQRVGSEVVKDQRLSLIGHWRACIRRGTDFQGRSSRRQYWSFVFWHVVFSFVLMLLDAVFVSLMLGSGYDMLSPFYFLFLLLTFFPSLAVNVRRLHDTGRSGWNYFWGAIPILGALILLVFFLEASVPEENKWGECPQD